MACNIFPSVSPSALRSGGLPSERVWFQQPARAYQAHALLFGLRVQPFRKLLLIDKFLSHGIDQHRRPEARAPLFRQSRWSGERFGAEAGEEAFGAPSKWCFVAVGPLGLLKTDLIH